MSKKLIRYSRIIDKYPREMILLQGKGCFWKKCTFCDYYLDTSNKMYKINKDVIDCVTGQFGMLDVINSGSAMELDDYTLNYLIDKVRICDIHTLWFESHWKYKDALNTFAKRFKNVDVKYRIGVETFNTEIRNKWDKGIPNQVTPAEISTYFKGVNLLFGIKGQNIRDILHDIEISEKFFERYIINIFESNTTFVHRDELIIRKFVDEIYPKIINSPKCEVLINNTDFGVG